MGEEFNLDGNGHEPGAVLEETESQEELVAIEKALGNLAPRPDGVLTQITKSDLSLLKQMIHAPTVGDALTSILLLCDFLDEDEANDILAAYYEAEELGMNTAPELNYALSRAVINRRGAHSTSRIGSVLHTLNPQKMASIGSRDKHYDNRNPSRSPLD